MKRSQTFMVVTSLLLVNVLGNYTPVYAKADSESSPEFSPVEQNPSDSQSRLLVNAIQNKPILVKDKRVFQKQFLQSVHRFVEKSPTSSMNFKNPHVYYCAGFVQQIYRDNGIWIPAHSIAQQTKFGVRIMELDRIEPGDVIFFSGLTSKKIPAHVAISIGHGKVLHAMGDNQQIKTLDLNGELRHHFMFAIRLVSSV